MRSTDAKSAKSLRVIAWPDDAVLNRSHLILGLAT